MGSGCASPSKGAPAANYGGAGGGSSGSSGNPAIGKYKGAEGDSSKGYERAEANKTNFSPAKSMSPLDRYPRPAQIENRLGSLKQYQVQRPESDSFFGMNALYRAVELGRYNKPMSNPPSVFSHMEDEENKKRKRHIF
ncbi:MAG: hypothetical protein HY517_04995 [Candidatus Aenigmarchaeota archaeon]|nr:hypothetical protein [Candidatus Aenigmarchaeota archaeon]